MTENFDAAQVWAQIEDCLVPYLRLDELERALYYYLMRHTRVQGQRTVRTSRMALVRNAGLGPTAVRARLRSLTRKGCLKLVECNLTGQLVEVFTPEEVPGCVNFVPTEEPVDWEGANCWKNPKLREAILRREKKRCFYCLRSLGRGTAMLDHIVSQAKGGNNTYRNMVACCDLCNTAKGSLEAEEYLRRLFRDNRLSPLELDGRLAALESVKAGKSKPPLTESRGVAPI